jgi:plastocyanin
MNRLVPLSVALLVATTGIGPAAAKRSAHSVVTGPQAKVYGYATPVIVVSKGEALEFANIDIERHDVVHDVETDGFGGPKRMRWCGKHDHAGHSHSVEGDCPVFWSKLIGFSETTRVLGLGNLEAGETYTFSCTLHHGMKGLLVVR